MFATESEIHRTLTLEAGITVVWTSSLCLQAYRGLVVGNCAFFLLINIFVQVFQSKAIPVSQSLRLLNIPLKNNL